MNSKKLTHVHVYIIGFVLALIVGAGLFYMLLKPLDEQNVALRRDVETKKTTPVQVDTASFTIAQRPQADKALVAAKERQAMKQSELNQLESSRRLPARSAVVIPKGGPDLQTTLPRWLVLAPVVVKQMEAYAHRIALKNRVKVTTSFGAPAPTTELSSIPTDIIAWNLGGMTVTGPFQNVMAWARDWNHSPLLTSVDGLKCSLAGPKGVVTATAGLTVYFFPTGPGVASPGASGGAAAATASPMGGFPGGGPMGGYPGGGAMGGYPGGGPMGYPGAK